MRFAGISLLGKVATWLAALPSPTYFGRHHLSRIYPKGYISPSASIHHSDLSLGSNVFIDDNVIIYQYIEGGSVKFGETVSIHRDSIIQTGRGGSLLIGSNTHIQVRCMFSAFVSPIIIGSDVQIASNCSFYSYDHGFALGIPIAEQPLQTKGGITIEDDVWLGAGVIVLDGVRIGKGAVVGAGSVVTHNISEGVIVAGVPAKVVNMRRNLAQEIKE